MRGRDREPETEPLTYADSGVDIAAGEKAVELIKDHVRSTFRPEVVGDIGGFGGLFALGRLPHRDPLLVSSTDGVGTKSLLASMTGRYDTIGIDCVAMSVDDIAAHGAEPLFFLDYISMGKLVPEQADEIVAGVARGCREAGCALIGGEMSEHPGILDPGEFDLVGFAVGVVERSEILPAEVRPGDAIVGFASPGLRCNGYSLARRALLERAGPHARRPRMARRAPLAGRRAARAERDLREGVARAAPARDGARVRARHRRRHPGQPRAGPAAALPRGRAPRSLGGAADLRRDPAGRRREPTTRWSRSSTSASACSRCCRATRRTVRSTPIRSAGHDAWLVGEVGRRDDGRDDGAGRP